MGVGAYRVAVSKGGDEWVCTEGGARTMTWQGTALPLIHSLVHDHHDLIHIDQ